MVDVRAKIVGVNSSAEVVSLADSPLDFYVVLALAGAYLLVLASLNIVNSVGANRDFGGILSFRNV